MKLSILLKMKQYQTMRSRKMMWLKVRLEEHFKQINELKHLIKFYENKQLMFSGFQKLTMNENINQYQNQMENDVNKKISKDDDVLWNRNVFENLKRFNRSSLEHDGSHRKISPTLIGI